MRVSIEYQGFPDERDSVIDRCAQVAKAQRDGSGFCFADGVRDVSLSCRDEEHAMLVAGMLRSNMPDTDITLWE
jgi:hypothetical protein